MQNYQNKEIKKTEAIVLKTLDYKENAQIVYFYGPLGRFNLQVKGVKKITSKTRNFTEILNYEKIDYTSNPTLGTLISGEVIDYFSGIKNDFVKVQVASCILEKVYYLGHLVKNTSDSFVFLKRILEILDETKYPNLVLITFETKFWYLLGIEPIIKMCANCNANCDSKQYFSLSAGGMVCHTCANDTYLDALDLENTKNLKYLYLVKMEKLNDDFLKMIDIDVNLVSKIIDEYYRKYIDFDSKAKKIYYKLCN